MLLTQQGVQTGDEVVVVLVVVAAGVGKEDVVGAVGHW